MPLIVDEKTDLRSDSVTAEEEALPPSYSVEPPRQEAPEDLSARLAQLDLSPPVKVSTVFLGFILLSCHLRFMLHLKRTGKSFGYKNRQGAGAGFRNHWNRSSIRVRAAFGVKKLYPNLKLMQMNSWQI